MHIGIRKVLLVVLAIMALFVGMQSAWASGSGTTRQLAVAQVQVKVLEKKAHKHQSVVNWWNNSGKWALGLKHKSCSEFKGSKRRKVCNMARQSLAYHSKHAKLVERKLASLVPWAKDVARTQNYRNCLIGHESAMTSDPYKAENGGTRGVEGPGYSDASGAYQFLDSTWRTMLRLAEQHYHAEISNTSHAGDATPVAQDAVAAFAIVEYNASDWTWNC